METVPTGLHFKPLPISPDTDLLSPTIQIKSNLENMYFPGGWEVLKKIPSIGEQRGVWIISGTTQYVQDALERYQVLRLIPSSNRKAYPLPHPTYVISGLNENWNLGLPLGNLHFNSTCLKPFCISPKFSQCQTSHRNVWPCYACRASDCWNLLAWQENLLAPLLPDTIFVEPCVQVGSSLAYWSFFFVLREEWGGAGVRRAKPSAHPWKPYTFLEAWSLSFLESFTLV